MIFTADEEISAHSTSQNKLAGRRRLASSTRRPSSFGLMALFVAVFPANINMAWKDVQPEGGHIPAALLWLRLPLQVVLVLWGWASLAEKAWLRD